MPWTCPPELQTFIDNELNKGEYTSEDEMVIEALQVLQELKLRHQSLQKDVLSAIAEADKGTVGEIVIEDVIYRNKSRKLIEYAGI